MGCHSDSRGVFVLGGVVFVFLKQEFPLRCSGLLT